MPLGSLPVCTEVPVRGCLIASQGRSNNSISRLQSQQTKTKAAPKYFSACVQYAEMLSLGAARTRLLKASILTWL